MAENKENKNLKNLTMKDLKRESKKLDTKTEHTIKINEEEYSIKIDNVFKPTKQHELMDDLIDFFQAGNDNVELLELATPYTSLLLIKHFTSLHIPNEIGDALDMLNVLVDLEVLGTIINLMPENEVVRIYETLTATVSRLKENISATEEEIERLAQEIDNQELRKMIDNGEDESK